MPSHHSTDPRYGWVLVAGGLVSIGFQSAIFFSNALLLVAIPEEAGWSRAATAAALSSLVLGSGVWAPIVGALLQRWGLRRAMPVSALLMAAGFAGLSLARSPEELAAAMLLLVSPGTLGVGSLANFTAIQAWFRQHRGAALSLADSGASLGLMLLVPLIQQLILGLGWRAALQMLAVGALLFARQLSDLVASRSFGSAMGLGQALGSLGGAVGATAAGLVHDATGTYLTSFAAAALMALASYGCMWAVGRGPRGAAAPPDAAARAPA